MRSECGHGLVEPNAINRLYPEPGLFTDVDFGAGILVVVTLNLDFSCVRAFVLRMEGRI